MDTSGVTHAGNPREPHIPGERLAALVDEAATVQEAQHLAACPACAEEVDAYRSLVALAAAERDSLGQPLTHWASLEAALARSGGLDGYGRVGARGPSTWWRPARNAAAAAVLLAAGVAIGRQSVIRQGSVPTKSIAGSSPAQIGNDRATNVSYTRQSGDTEAFASKTQALDALEQAEDRYRYAAAYLMFADSSAQDENPDAYRTRLAALDEVAQTTRAALRMAPNDPVLNQWYISSVGARQATLRQLGQALPQGQKLRGF